MAFDPGPPPAVADHLAAVPSYAEHRTLFWYDWGPIFYRGRLDRTAKVLCIASDPGPTERIAGRTLVGDAGQRVQGFLAKLGLTGAYACVNAYAYALLPSQASHAIPLLTDPAHLTWRNALLDLIVGPDLQAVVAFGQQAQIALEHWTGVPAVTVKKVPHPSSRDAARLAEAWRDALTELRGVVSPDDGGDASGPTYGAELVEADYARIPAADLPFGVPPWLGDDHRGRTSVPRRNNCVERAAEDKLHTLVWHAPDTTPA